MIPIFSIPLAIAFPLVEGALALRLIEGSTPVLYRIERWAMGFLLGCTMSAFIIFFAVFFGVPLTLFGFLCVHVAILATLMVLRYKMFPYAFPDSPKLVLPSIKSMRKALPRWVLILGFWMILWTALKIGLGGYDIFSVPSYWDDSYANWNMRSKIMYENESLMLEEPRTSDVFFGGRAEGYPLTVYFTKIWFVMVNGEWNEAVVNGISYIWFLAFLICFFLALLRAECRDDSACSRSPNAFAWSALATYVLVSVPLFLVQGTNPYSDVFMASHLFFVIYFFYQWMDSTLRVKGIEEGRRVHRDEPSQTRVWLHLFGFSTALMLFVKNEAFMIFLPPLFVVMVLFCIFALHQSLRSDAGLRAFGAWFGPILVIAVPWLTFKFFYDLGFGNNRSVAGSLSLSPNSEVLKAIEGDLLYTGSFMLLFPLTLLVLVITWRRWIKSSLGLIILFIGIVFVGECMIYYLVPSMATEAIRHTGFGRGMIHLVPGIVFVVILLLKDLIEGES
jgi:hypothetical protein